MPLGDLLAKVGKGDKLSASEVESLRLLGNDVQQRQGVLSGVVDSVGRLAPDVFQKSAAMSPLPHEAASLYNGNAQNVATGGSYTTLVPDATSGATWGMGMQIDKTNGYIYTKGMPIDSVMWLHCTVQWDHEVANGAVLYLSWFSDAGDSMGRFDIMPTVAGDPAHYAQTVDHFRRTGKAAKYYYVGAKHDQGGNLALAQFIFTCVRLR